MNFDEFWQEMVGRGTPDNAVNRTLVQAAWDAALCAAQAIKWDAHRQPMDTLQWASRIGQLHTWVKLVEGGEA